MSFPVDISNNDYARLQQAKDWIFENEGQPIQISSGGTGNSATVSGTTSLTGISPYCPPGFLARVKQITIQSNIAAFMNGTFQDGSFANGDRSIINFAESLPINGGVISKNFDKGLEWVEGGGFQIYAIAYETRSTAAPYSFSIDASGARTIWHDKNYLAKYVVCMFGNSISWGTIGNIAGGSTANKGKTHYFGRLQDSVKAASIDARFSNRGFGGNLIDNLNSAIDSRIYDGQQRNCILFNFGTNESAIGTATATGFQAKIEYAIDYFFGSKLMGGNPNCTIILVAPTPTDTATRSTNIQSYRDVLAGIVSGTLNSNKYAAKVTAKQLLYADTSANWGTIVDSDFCETGSNNHLHPRGDTGHLKVYNNVWPVFQQSAFYLNPASSI